jgi:hypothetical protein
MQFDSRKKFRLRRIAPQAKFFQAELHGAGREVNSHNELNVTILQHVCYCVCVSHVTKRPAELRAETPKIDRAFGPSKIGPVPSTAHNESHI